MDRVRCSVVAASAGSHVSKYVVTDTVTMLLGCLDSPRREEVAAIRDLDTLLAGQLEEAAREWPAVQLAPAAYVRHLADKLQQRASEPAEEVLRALPAADLYLAAACAAGNSAAITAFHDEVLPVIRPALAKLGLSQTTIDEAEQRVLVMILVGDPVRPAIATFGGRGRLRSWVKSIAVRTARRLAGLTEGGAPNEQDELDRLSANVDDPELALLRERYREQVRDALAAAFGALAERQRNVLRQYYIDGLTIDQLAALYHVDRATTARWVIAARGAVLDGMHDRMRHALGVSSEEVESILRLVRSELDLSLRLLR
jgi:RNA polymerase sigma-70 factor (ECF subfamily)